MPDPDFLYAAAFIKESRVNFANAMNLDRKSGEGQGRL